MTLSSRAAAQAAGTAAALCAVEGFGGVRDLPYPKLYRALRQGNVWFDAEH